MIDSQIIHLNLYYKRLSIGDQNKIRWIVLEINTFSGAFFYNINLVGYDTYRVFFFRYVCVINVINA